MGRLVQRLLAIAPGAPAALAAALSVVACRTPAPASAPQSREERAPPSPSATAPTGSPEPLAFVEPVDGCRVELPRGRSGGVLGVALLDRIMASAEGPLSAALCGCVPPRSSADVRVEVSPELGTVAAATGDAPLDACLASALADRRFPAWELGSDCIGCGPARVTWFPHLAVREAPPPASRVMFPVHFTR